MSAGAPDANLPEVHRRRGMDCEVLASTIEEALDTHVRSGSVTISKILDVPSPEVSVDDQPGVRRR